MDLRLSPDVNAAGRLVKDEDSRGHHEPPADEDFLLVATTERGDFDSLRPGVDRQRLDDALDFGPLSQTANKAHPAQGPQGTEREVGTHGEHRDKPPQPP